MAEWAARPEGLLVVIEADDAEHARRETGLLDADFSPAADDDVDEWEAICDTPLTAEDAARLLTALRREVMRVLSTRKRKREDPLVRARRRVENAERELDVARSRLAVLERGDVRVPEREEFDARDVNLIAAARLAQLRGKLEMAAAEAPELRAGVPSE